MKSLNSEKLPKKLILKGGTVLDPLKNEEKKADLLIENGKIAGIEIAITTDGARSIDCSGKIITHGFCDLHAHLREPGREDKETLATGSQAALAGGFTTVCVMPNTNPPLDSPESIRFILEKAESLPVTVYPIGAITKGQKGKVLTEMGVMVKSGAVAFSDDGHTLSDSGVMRRSLEYSSSLGVAIINHSEDLALKGDGQMHEGTWSTKLGLTGIPDVSESTIIHRDLEINRMIGGKIHIPHVSSRKSLEVIEKMKKIGVNVTVEVTPHHLYFTDENLESYNTNFKVAPPIRCEEDREALINGVKNGLIDCIATDHAPHTVEDKEMPFDLAPPGMIGLESAFGAVWKKLGDASVSLIDVIKALTIKPREVIGLETDLFNIGRNPELVILDPDKEWKFTQEDIYSKSRNSPFIGEQLRGKVTGVVNGGLITLID